MNISLITQTLPRIDQAIDRCVMLYGHLGLEAVEKKINRRTKDEINRLVKHGHGEGVAAVTVASAMILASHYAMRCEARASGVPLEIIEREYILCLANDLAAHFCWHPSRVFAKLSELVNEYERGQ